MGSRWAEHELRLGTPFRIFTLTSFLCLLFNFAYSGVVLLDLYVTKSHPNLEIHRAAVQVPNLPLRYSTECLGLTLTGIPSGGRGLALACGAFGGMATDRLSKEG